MSKIKDATEYYDIFLEKHTKDEAIELLKEAGFSEYDYDPISSTITVRALQDPVMVFSDMKWQKDGDEYRLVW